MASSHIITKDEALSLLLESPEERAPLLFEHGTLTVKIYGPRGIDRQTPHERDEVYVVIRGGGEFVCAEERRRVKEHDFIFVRAGAEHRFENFSDDLMVWVLFYGVKGGES